MKDVEIGSLGETKYYMKLDELFRIANKEIQEYAVSLELENSKLLYKLDKATEALKKYADPEHYIGVSANGEAFEFEESEYGLDEMKIGWLARQTLKEIEK